MRPYWTMFRLRMMLLFQYRVSALAGICTQVMFGLYLVMAMCVFYGSTDAPQSMTLVQSVTYIWIGQAMLGMLPWNGDREIMNLVRSGQIAADLCRPVDLYGLWFARSLALRSAPTLLKAIPIFVIGALLPAPYTMRIPSWTEACAWLFSVAGAWVLSASVTNLFYIVMFWTTTGDGFARLLPSAVTLFSGMVIPLPLFPDAMKTFLFFQPFSGLTNLPNQLYVGLLPPERAGEVVLVQLCWTAFFVLLGRALTRRGLRRVTIAGG